MEKIYRSILRIWVYTWSTVLKKNETATMFFFLKKPSYISSLLHLTYVLILTCQPSCSSSCDVECRTRKFCVENVYNYAKFGTVAKNMQFLVTDLWLGSDKHVK